MFDYLFCLRGRGEKALTISVVMVSFFEVSAMTGAVMPIRSLRPIMVAAIVNEKSNINKTVIE